MKIQNFKNLNRSTETDIPEEIFRTLEPLNEQLQALTTGARRRLSFEDNFNAQVHKILLKDDIAVDLSVDKVRGKANRVEVDTPGFFDYYRLAWKVIDENKIRVKVKWDSAPTDKVDATIVVFGS